MKRKGYNLILIFFFTIFINAQVTSFKSGENLSYSVSFNGSGISSNVMEINMRVSTVNIKGKSFFKLYGDAKTYSNFDRVFKIRDFFESYVYKNSLEPIYHKRSTNEGGHQKEEIYTFKRGRSNAQVGIKTTRKGRVSDPNYVGYSKNNQLTVGVTVKDILGSLYYLRAIPLSSVPKGKKVEVQVLFDGKQKTLKLRNDGVVTLNTAIGTKKCYKFSTSAQGDNNSFSGSIYFTADANKVPVLIEADIPVGKGTIKLKNATGLRN